MNAHDPAGELRLQTEVARRLLEQLAGIMADEDKILVSDTVEGETGLFEAIERALRAIEDCEVLEHGLTAHLEVMAERKRRILGRRELLAGLIEQALLATGISPLRLPTATLSVARRAQGLVLQNEADVPSRYWVLPDPPAPRLDKKAILNALNAGETVPGAMLAEPSFSLTIRRK